ncbi:MAG: MBL fold metallo-hydrolase [Oligoflexia bacterium]|nr:MBL fold metallo-hydrolase [Oligoflexia bacterium]
MFSSGINIKDFQNDKLTISVHVIGSLSNNCITIYSPKTLDAIIIDSGNDNDAILRLIKKFNLKVQKLVYTHAHYDHITSADVIRSRFTNAKLYLHEQEMPVYRFVPQQVLMTTGENLNKLNPVDQFVKEGEKLGLELSDGVDGVEGEEFKGLLNAIHTPGHTPGHLCFLCNFFSIPILFSGDTLFQQSVGRTDLPGGSFGQIQKSIKEKLFTLPENTVVIPGHGDFTTIGEEKKYNPFVRG